MKKVIVASENPVKIEATRLGFETMLQGPFQFSGSPIPSGVSDQPMSDAETLRGAINRADTASEQYPEADYWVGLEGGLEETNKEMYAFAWMIIKSKSGQIGKGKTATFFLPPDMAELVRQGKELAHVTDEIFKETNSKQKQGTISFLTGGAIDRTKYYLNAIIIALMPFKHPELYKITRE